METGTRDFLAWIEACTLSRFDTAFPDPPAPHSSLSARNNNALLLQVLETPRVHPRHLAGPFTQEGDPNPPVRPRQPGGKETQMGREASYREPYRGRSSQDLFPLVLSEQAVRGEGATVS